MSNLPKIGIDLGSSSVKMVELASVGKDKWKLLSAASMPSQGSVIGNKSSINVVVADLARLLKEAGVRGQQAVASIPEELAYSHLVNLPVMSETEIDQALSWQVEQYIPIPKDQVVWSYDITKKDEVAGEIEVMLVAVPKTVAEWYRQVLEQSGLNVLALETELAATARAVVPVNVSTSVIVDIGSKGTDIGVVRNGKLVFSRVVPTAGEAFTRAIETTLGLESAVAEQYKNSYGFANNQLEGKLLEAMKPVLNMISLEVRKTMDFHVSKHAGEIIKMVTLSGGVAALPDVVSALSALLGVEVIIANPFSKVNLDDSQKKALTGHESFYAVAVGLSMKGM